MKYLYLAVMVGAIAGTMLVAQPFDDSRKKQREEYDLARAWDKGAVAPTSAE
jgi:hypothetical protein